MGFAVQRLSHQLTEESLKNSVCGGRERDGEKWGREGEGEGKREREEERERERERERRRMNHLIICIGVGTMGAPGADAPPPYIF